MKMHKCIETHQTYLLVQWVHELQLHPLVLWVQLVHVRPVDLVHPGLLGHRVHREILVDRSHRWVPVGRQNRLYRAHHRHLKRK